MSFGLIHNVNRQTARGVSTRRRFGRRLGSWRTLCLALLAAGSTIAVGDEPARGDDTAGEPNEELWFPVGESFEYRLLWGVLRVGEAWLETSWDEFEGRRVLAIRGGARTTNWLVERIYPIRNQVETLVDPVTFLPLRYDQQVREGRRRRDETVRFFHDRGVAEHTSHRKRETKQVSINPDTRDLLTLFYAVRRDGMEPGETAEYQVLVDDELYDLTLTAEVFETVDLPRLGSVRSLRIEPTAMFGEVFVRRGRMWAWVSDDDRRVCARISADLPVAQVHAVLIAVGGPGEDRWVRGGR